MTGGSSGVWLNRLLQLSPPLVWRRRLSPDRPRGTTKLNSPPGRTFKTFRNPALELSLPVTTTRWFLVQRKVLFQGLFLKEPGPGCRWTTGRTVGSWWVSCVLPVSGRGSTGRAAVCSILLTLQCSLAPNSAETTDLRTEKYWLDPGSYTVTAPTL